MRGALELEHSVVERQAAAAVLESVASEKWYC